MLEILVNVGAAESKDGEQIYQRCYQTNTDQGMAILVYVQSQTRVWQYWYMSNHRPGYGNTGICPITDQGMAILVYVQSQTMAINKARIINILPIVQCA